jgi:hypothetical protein
MRGFSIMLVDIFDFSLELGDRYCSVFLSK